MKKNTLFFLALFITLYSFSQNTFTLNTSDNVNAAIQTPDSNFIISGGLYGSDVPLFKISAAGQLIWSKTISMKNSGDGIYSTGNNIINTADGGFAVSGTYNNNLALCKFSETGNLQWSKEYIDYAGSNGDKVLQTDDGGYLLATTAFVHKNLNTNPDSPRCFLVKTDAAGNVQWSKNYFINVLSQVTDLKKTKDGNYVFTSINSVDQSLYGDTSYITEINSTGSVIESYFIFNPAGPVYIHSVLPTTDSGFLAVGHTIGSSSPGGFAIKLNKAGITQWSKLTSAGSVDYTAIEANNGNYIVAGGAPSSNKPYYYFTEIDQKGVQQWSKAIKSNDLQGADIAVFSLLKTFDSGYLATGVHAEPIIIKFDSALNSCEPEEKLDGLTNFIAFNPAVISVDNGSFIDTSVNIPLINQGSIINTCGILPVTLLSFTAHKQNNTTMLQWQTTNEINNSYFSVERSPDLKLFTLISNKPATNNPLRSNYSFVDNLPLNDLNYYRLKQVDKDGKFTYSNVVSVDFAKNSTLFTISPNPAKDYINITSSGNVTNAQISIIDMNGRTLYTARHNFNGGEQIKIPSSQFAKQLLLVTINTTNGKQQFKVVKE